MPKVKLFILVKTTCKLHQYILEGDVFCAYGAQPLYVYDDGNDFVDDTLLDRAISF